jgi:RNA polymerase sigma factor (sigma-70 family)
MRGGLKEIPSESAFKKTTSRGRTEKSVAMGDETGSLVDHFFRHEHGKLVAALSRVFGLNRLDLVEDVVQSALLEALHSWKLRGAPREPGAWIYRVARNKALDALRRERTAARLAPDVGRSEVAEAERLDDALLDSRIRDSQLRMIFACCHPQLSPDVQIALTLKTLCGFSDAEISRALLIHPDTAKKRIYRAKQQLIAHQVGLEAPPADQLTERLDAVHSVLYLLFNEGYCSSSSDDVIRYELCSEAVRLAEMLCEHAEAGCPASFALLALMLFHAGRFASRLDDTGSILLLEDQDRSKWDGGLLRRAAEVLAHSAEGSDISSYHLEAGIAMHHCLAPRFEDTNWSAIRLLYDALCRHYPSPVYALNRSLVIAQLEGPAAGLAAIEAIADRQTLSRYHWLDAAIGELQRRLGNTAAARRHLEIALSKTASPREQELLGRKLARLAAEHDG